MKGMTNVFAQDVGDAPCVWPLDPACCPGWPTDPDEWTEHHRTAVQIATEIMWRLTAGQYGLCPVKIRPCRTGCAGGQNWLWGMRGGFPYGMGWSTDWVLNPYTDDQGRWFNFGCGCGTQCSCKPLCILEIPGRVHAILEVRIDGQVLPETGNWKLDRRPGKARLIRIGGDPNIEGDCWPRCQHLDQPDTEPGTFSITYLQGRPVPAAGVRAISALACEVYKQCQGGTCRLPDGIRTIQREGLTIDVLPPGDWLETLRVTMPAVYGWVSLVNPNQLRQAPAVFSLDMPEAPMHERVRYPWM
jgi:hypothetical protein